MAVAAKEQKTVKSVLEESVLIQAEKRRTGLPVRTDYTRSGDAEQILDTFSPGSRVTRVVVKVKGTAFEGKLKYLKGVKVTSSPVAYGSDGKPGTPPAGQQQAFIADFGGMRSLLELKVLATKGKITLILPWMGTEFSPRPLYPPPAVAGQFSPVPDSTGTADVGLAGVETMKLLVQIKAGTPLSDNDLLENCRITTAVYPSNVTAWINDRPPFWTHSGVLDSQVEVNGLTDELNALLKDSKAPAQAKLLFVSETPGVLLVDFVASRDLDAELTTDARWGSQPSLDVTVQPLEKQEVTLSFPSPGNKPWRVSRLGLDLAGRFPLWQAFSGQGTDAPGKLGFRIDAHFSVARRLVFSEDGELHGLSLLLKPPADAVQMRVEAAAEKDGQPDQGKSLAVADVSLHAGTGTEPFWHEVLFPEPVTVKAQEVLWLTVKARTGAAEWVGVAETASSPAPTLYNNEGGLWQVYPLLEGKYPTAQIKVLRRPFDRENTPLLDVVLGVGAQAVKQSLDLSEEVTRLELSLPAGQFQEYPVGGGTMQIPVTVLARAGGTVAIKGATAFYKEKG